MHRSSRGLAAIWLVGWVAVSPIVSAQDAKPIPLPAVQIDAPQQRQDARFKRKHSADRGGRSNRTAIQNPVSVANAAPAQSALGASAAAAPVASSSEKNVSGEEVNARPFSRPAEALEVVPGLIITQHSGDGKANQYFLRGFLRKSGGRAAGRRCEAEDPPAPQSGYRARPQARWPATADSGYSHRGPRSTRDPIAKAFLGRDSSVDVGDRDHHRSDHVYSNVCVGAAIEPRPPPCKRPLPARSQHPTRVSECPLSRG